MTNINQLLVQISFGQGYPQREVLRCFRNSNFTVVLVEKQVKSKKV
jgi:hypothetical protein